MNIVLRPIGNSAERQIQISITMENSANLTAGIMKRGAHLSHNDPRTKSRVHFKPG